MAFPNLKGKHLEDSIVTPQEFLTYLKSIGKYPKYKPPEAVIFIFSSKLFRHILKNLKPKEVEFSKTPFYLLENGKVGIFAKFGIGAPITTTQMEELIAFGVKKFISIGEAGTLQKNLKIRDIVVCDRAIRDEGTSHHYLKHSKYAYASKELTEKVEKVLQRIGQKFIVGASWTTDAPYRETVAEAKQYQKERVATV
ncbi:MAG: nucleoside phosphorylase, partial [archaeon]